MSSELSGSVADISKVMGVPGTVVMSVTGDAKNGASLVGRTMIDTAEIAVRSASFLI